MDAVKFIEERNRMCNSTEGCSKCSAFDDKMYGFCAVGRHSTMSAVDQVALVEEWSAAHPRKTRQSVLLEQYPEVKRSADGVPTICPANLSLAYRNDVGNCIVFPNSCTDCMSNFWRQEV